MPTVRACILSVMCSTAGALSLAAAAWADDHERRPRTPLLPAYLQECGACHIAYAPALLPAPAWQAIMEGLSAHYGGDAALDDAATAQTITDWLIAHAATGRKRTEVPPENRISRAAWFVRKHDEVPRDAWARPSIRSASNCAACHPDAAHGNFDDDEARIPR